MKLLFLLSALAGVPVDVPVMDKVSKPSEN
jgi:hypothetical protein